MRCLYREKIYETGDYLELDIYPVFRKAGVGRRRPKAKPTREIQTRLNQRNAERELIRILNANFTEQDISVTLTYADEYLPETFEQTERDVSNFLRKLKRLRTKVLLPELKYVKIPGEGRFHFHIPMSGGIDDKMIQALWGYGYANVIHFEFNENGIEGHARYIATQYQDDQFPDADLLSMLDIDEATGEVTDLNKKRKKGKRRYTCSRNIVHPKPEHKDGRLSRARVEELAKFDSDSKTAWDKIYPGYSFVRCIPYYNQDNGGYYLHVRFYRNDAAFVRKKRPTPRRKPEVLPFDG